MLPYLSVCCQTCCCYIKGRSLSLVTQLPIHKDLQLEWKQLSTFKIIVSEEKWAWYFVEIIEISGGFTGTDVSLCALSKSMWIFLFVPKVIVHIEQH